MRIVAASTHAHRLPDVASGRERIVRASLDPDLVAELDVDLVAVLHTGSGRAIGVRADRHLMESFSFHANG